MKSYIQSFIHLSRYAGMREDLVQAGGGNSSLKISQDEMLIKASGFSLSEVSEDTGFVRVNPKIIADFFSSTDFKITKEAEKNLITDCVLPPPIQNNSNSINLRPSIEVFLHSITQKYTLHTHQTVVNILASTENGWETLKTLFPGSLFVDYATPGIKLAAEYFSAFKAFGKTPDVIFLKNHGLFVAGESSESVKDRTEEILLKIEQHLSIDMSRFHSATKIYDVTRKIPLLKDKIVFLSEHSAVKEGIKIFGSELWKWQFCPDCIVYLGKKPLVLRDDFSEQDFSTHIETYGIPAIISHKGNAYILADSVRKAKETESVLSFSAQVAIANKNSSINSLSVEEQNFLLDWDAEKYRRNMK